MRHSRSRTRPAAACACALLLALPAGAQDGERCYGVALAGQNEGVGAESAPGGATQDYQGNAWVTTPPGTCLTLPLPPRPDGTPRRGSHQPLDRDAPG